MRLHGFFEEGFAQTCSTRQARLVQSRGEAAGLGPPTEERLGIMARDAWGSTVQPGAMRSSMCDQDHFEKDGQEYEALGLVTRKQFGIMLGASVAMMLPRVANAVTVTESDVNVTTPDGAADCYFAHPASGTAPGVLVWPDIFGLRPAFRQMGKRLAESGYSVLVVNPFYRAKKAPTAPAGGATPIADVMPLARGL